MSHTDHPSRSRQQSAARLACLGSVQCCALLFLVLAAAAVTPVSATVACTATAWSMYRSCVNESFEDYWEAVAICINADADEVGTCQREARQDRAASRRECRQIRVARAELCDQVGEEPYNPEFDGEDFASEFHNQNLYFPLAPGNRWVYEAEDERIVVEVQAETKNIEGVPCITVNDLVSEEGMPIEDTDDWFAQAHNGDVYYCGEISLNFEIFDGDDPEIAELVDIDGSWKAGRDDAKPGVLMFAAPQVGAVYRQEMALGDAEDAGEVLSTDYRYGEDSALDAFVPQELADLFCDGDCVVILDFTPLEPEIAEHKFYAPGVGLFLEVDLEDGSTSQLVECNIDPRCAELGEP